MATRFEAWRAAWRRFGSPRGRAGPARWLVVDVESSGLDAAHDRLLAIAATAVHLAKGGPQIALADSFSVVLKAELPADPAPDRANILLHGIGLGAQRAGVPVPAALQAFVDFAGGDPMVAFHAAFDRTLIHRARADAGLAAAPADWLDLAALAPVLVPDHRAESLDDWLAHFGIRCLARHQAAADALATAELLLALWPLMRRQLGRDPDFAAASRLAALRRWLPP